MPYTEIQTLPRISGLREIELFVRDSNNSGFTKQ